MKLTIIMKSNERLVFEKIDFEIIAGHLRVMEEDTERDVANIRESDISSWWAESESKWS